jgi:cullin-4
MHATGGPKRLLVKNFKPTRKVDPKVFLNQTWDKIEKALDTIFAQGQVDFSLEELYRGVENVCRQGMAKDVKDRLVAKCKEYVGGKMKAKVEESLGRGNVEVLRATLQAWAVWHEQVVSLDVLRKIAHINGVEMRFGNRLLTAPEIPRLDFLLPRPRLPTAPPRISARNHH